MAGSARKYTRRNSVKDVVGRIERLPAPSAVAVKILNLAMQEEKDFSVFSRLIESDQSLSLKVLRMANSLAYGYTGRIEDLRKALVVLGTSTLKQIMLGVIVRDGLLKDPKCADEHLRRIWKHSLAGAVAAHLSAEAVAPEVADSAFVAGLLHDCGKLALLTVIPGEYEKLLDAAEESGEALDELEREAFGVDHGTVGKWLAEKWGLPKRLVDAVWLHHQPVEALDELEGDMTLVKLAVLGNLLAHEVMFDDAHDATVEQRDRYAENLRMNVEDLEDIKKQIGERFAERAEIFDFDNDAALFYFEALQNAKNHVVDLNIELDEKNDIIARSNRVLNCVGDTGLKLARAKSEGEIFTIAAEAFRDGIGVGECFIYRVDVRRRRLDGLLVGRTGRLMQTSCPLDENGVPDVRHEQSSVPLFLEKMLKSRTSRIPPLPMQGNEGAGPAYIDPFYVIPMIADWEFLGEVIFNFPEKSRSSILPQEMSGFVQLSALTAAALNRLDLNAKLKERAERLASAMHKIKQINLKLMQTERLASVGQLAAGAAHEINNPLAIIYARAQLLEMRESDEGKKKNFRQMMEQIERITSILNNLMDFAKPSPPVMEKIDLNEVVERALTFVMSGLEKRDIKVSTAFSADLPRIDGDPRRLEQVFLNLLINAEHALEGKDGDAKIKVVTAVDKLRSVVTAAVSDNGMGIPKDNLRKIFDPFFTTKEEGKGTGLGLSTSYGIVSSHYGDIKVKSIVGKGTTMMVELPMDRANAKENAEKVADSEAILVVDDEQTVRELLEEALSDQGYDVDAVADAEEGLRKLREKKYNLLLLDIRMPRMGGLSFLSKVKDFTDDMPVVILTGMAGKDEIDKALDLGARSCIQKPFQMEPFLAQVRQIMENKKKDGGLGKNAQP